MFISGVLISIILICYGIVGNLGTAVSYKFEIDDPTIEISINRLDKKEKTIAYNKLISRKKQLNNQSVFYGVMITVGITSLFLLLIKRKRILRIEK